MPLLWDHVAPRCSNNSLPRCRTGNNGCDVSLIHRNSNRRCVDWRIRSAQPCSEIHHAGSTLWVETVVDTPYGPSPANRIRVQRPRWNRRRSSRCSCIPRRVMEIRLSGGYEYRVCRQYLDAGLVVGNVEYRLGLKAPAAVEDALRAAAWFAGRAAQFGADPAKLVVTGESAGAHLALMVGLLGPGSELGSGAKVSAIVGFYGITDLRQMLGSAVPEDFVRRWPAEGHGNRDHGRKHVARLPGESRCSSVDQYPRHRRRYRAVRPRPAASMRSFVPAERPCSSLCRERANRPLRPPTGHRLWSGLPLPSGTEDSGGLIYANLYL